MVQIKLLSEPYEGSYNNLLSYSNEATLYSTMEYRNLLKDFLDCEPYYLIAIVRNQVVGALPSMIKEGGYGPILNSLPFFGSHGGVLTDSRLPREEQVRVKLDLLEALKQLASEKKCTLSTIKTSPFEKDIAFYEDNLSYAFKTHRLTQITHLPPHTDNLSDQLMQLFEPRCRWSIRKALKQGFDIFSSRKPDHVAKLQQLHADNLRAVRGPTKPLDFFIKALRYFPNDKQCELLCAFLNDKMIAGLLYFTFKNQVEYFTPAFDLQHSSKQPNSLLIYEGMLRSVPRGVRYWNFGGTLPSSKGLYMFKKSWAARDYPYYYYTLKHRDITHFEKLSPKEILAEYEWFYVIPFPKKGEA